MVKVVVGAGAALLLGTWAWDQAQTAISSAASFAAGGAAGFVGGYLSHKTKSWRAD